MTASKRVSPSSAVQMKIQRWKKACGA
ncbi:uncharacterized protein G2W53_036939 [Senna tora]|uniref:Uncharacterized protein n=1 Tax=Senna tora TaxID=362788 RepID=A0A834SWD3_9FABA|nr:uncharacterized protein G2W53_036939 [Senna tora]